MTSRFAEGRATSATSLEPTDCPLAPGGYSGASVPYQTMIQQGPAACGRQMAHGVSYDESPPRLERPLVWALWDSTWIRARISLEFLLIP